MVLGAVGAVSVVSVEPEQLEENACEHGHLLICNGHCIVCLNFQYSRFCSRVVNVVNFFVPNKKYRHFVSYTTTKPPRVSSVCKAKNNHQRFIK